MLCYAIDQKPTNLGSPASPEMYRNLQSESNTAPSGGFFQSNYPPKLGTASSYTPPNYSVLTSHPTLPEYPTSSLSLDYQPTFIPSGHDVTTTQSAWGYPNPNFQSMLNTHPSWDGMGNSFHHPQTSTNTHYHTGLPQAPLVNGSSSPGSSAALTGIECFATPPDGAVGIHVSTMHPGIQTQRRPYEWINKNAYQNIPPQQVGKTRTKDKYRVVYSDHQRLELEKEFRFSRYITIRRKAELAGQLCLSERQVKIWFQNRRAKERKASKKNGEHAKQNDGDVIDEQEDADDDVSEHSGHGMTSSPPMMQHSNGAFVKTSDVHPNEQTFAIPEPQDGAMAHQLPPMPYNYGVHHSPQDNLHYEQMGSMAELKPILCNTEPHVLSPTDSTGTHQMRISPTCHQL